MEEIEIPKVFPELGLPQVVPVIQDLLDEYIKKPENLPIHSLKKNLRHIRPGRNLDCLFSFHSRSFPLVQRVKRDPATGKLVEYEEVEVSCLGETAKNSLSLSRAPGAKDDGLKGSSTNFPFWPGGFDEEKELSESTNKIEALKIDESEAKLFEKLFEKDLLWVAPTFKEGLFLSSSHNGNKDPNYVIDSDADVFADDRKPSFDFWKSKDSTNPEYQQSPAKLAKKESKAKHLLNELSDDIFNLQDDSENKVNPVLKISKTPSTPMLFMPWAEMIDVTKPMSDFNERVPDMAKKFPFELDTFQKQAITKLEEHENVFVAAHTSAGKTVVAEYAIALSVQHMTRTIYTSPIKALSNQKFRDFKMTFESVGLVTGDVQINPTASVLIMTTEILRSMLYNGSDVIRDLEWVVFDEIHYLNNEERGHVWEEVLIMLPPHVSIIMLSATVPNAMQFANWVGEIKKKKIFVISTPKRPVPLEHFLYTGSGGKSKDEIFLVLDGEGRFLKRGVDMAKDAKLSRMSKHQQGFGPKGGKNVFNESTEKNTYIGLINHLKGNKQLPVVIFTFSRNRCDQYAQLMNSVDLCDGAKEKGEIHGFFMKSISRLKGSDRDLPQVKTFHEMLKNGIGVHHSGILPILKEVVEMLFQIGLVKLLFATETFAMGVNMPARTVVFDSIRKHDGTCFRTLNPAEYIQMAGRAGRRGLDPTGSVIILCKNQYIPDILELQNMMTGKAAKLESQFRLTYSMILNLLRVESLTVEDVMKRSFLEATARMKVDTLKEKLQKIQRKVSSLEWENEFDPELINFYNSAKDCLNLQEDLTPFLKAYTKNNLLLPGRVILMEHLPSFSTRFGVILESIPPKANPANKFKVLTLTSPKDNLTLEDLGYEMSSILDQELLDIEEIGANIETRFGQYLYYSNLDLIQFVPELNDNGFFPHTVLEINYNQVLSIVDKIIRVDSETIISNIKTREAPRFINQLPPSNVRKVLDELASINHLHREQSIIFGPQRVIAVKDVNLIIELQKFEQLKINIKLKDIEGRANFKQKFHEVFCFMRLKDTLEYFEFLLSPRSLRLHEDYQSRIQVLRKLGYIDGDNLVQMKGRVACEMGNQNELMVTEMVLNNMFATAPPAEVAAILSCLVFEAKKVEEPSLDGEPVLKQRVAEVKELARTIGKTQVEFGIKEPTEQYVEQFRFGLAEVVHEWAKGKCFCDIMKLTDVQEGLIVRTIQRLDEMIRDVKDAARIIGDPSLKKKMEESSECIKRDIVFAASLYTQ